MALRRLSRWKHVTVVPGGVCGSRVGAREPPSNIVPIVPIVPRPEIRLPEPGRWVISAPQVILPSVYVLIAKNHRKERAKGARRLDPGDLDEGRGIAE